MGSARRYEVVSGTIATSAKGDAKRRMKRDGMKPEMTARILARTFMQVYDDRPSNRVL
jgi:hypothetical protein